MLPIHCNKPSFGMHPGGRAPQFEGSVFFPFGLNGIRLDPVRQYLHFAVSTTANPVVGKIYRIPLLESPDSSNLEQFHVYAASELPDQLAFGANGKLYVISLALSNLTPPSSPQSKFVLTTNFCRQIVQI